jgi:phosphoserine/homoserine phosphotransferase
MQIVCTDLEGVLVPEIWINVAEKTGIDELRLTTRDIADYDVLMQKRLSLLDKHGLKLKDITDVIEGMEPLEGALDFLEWLRPRTQLIIVSDTYTQFAGPLMRKLGWPTLFCHTLVIDDSGAISGYHLRQKEAKRKTVLALQSMNYEVIGMGDSYNDIAMLQQAANGILFRPPPNVCQEYPDLPVTRTFEELKQALARLLH